MIWCMLWDLSVHNTSLPFDHNCCLDKSELETCLRFPVSGNRNRKLQSELVFFLQQLNSILPTNTSTFDTSSTPTPPACPIFMFLFLSTCGGIHSDSGNLLLPKVLHLPHFPFRHLHEVLQSVPCHHLLAQRLDSKFSLDLRAHCSAILVSRLLSIVHIVGFCGNYFSVQAEIENVVFGTNCNMIVLFIQAHQFLEVISHSSTNFAVNRDHVPPSCLK